MKKIEKIISNCRLLEADHSANEWPAIQMKDIMALLDEIERLKIFEFEIGDKVIVKLNGIEYIGEIVSRLESHKGGIRYAVYANYRHAKEAYWFSENEIIKTL